MALPVPDGRVRLEESVMNQLTLVGAVVHIGAELEHSSTLESTEPEPKIGREPVTPTMVVLVSRVEPVEE